MGTEKDWNGSYANVNPNTDLSLSTLQSYLNGGANANPIQLQDIQNFLAQGTQPVASTFDPAAGFNQFLNQSGGLQQAAMGQYSPLLQGLNAMAADQARQSIANTASQFSGGGALHSGAAAAAMAEAGARPFAEVQNNLGMNMANASAALQQMGLQGALQGNQFGAGLNAQIGQGNQNAYLNSANTLASMYGANLGLEGQALAGLAGYGDPMMEYQPGIWGNIGSGLSAIAPWLNFIPGIGVPLSAGVSAAGSAMKNPK